MKANKKNHEITQVLTSGRLILDCYKKYGCPTEGNKYKAFVYDALVIAQEYPKYYNLDGFFQFLMDNEGNNLPYPSSGSLRVALEDFDCFGSAVGYEDDDFTDENLNYMKMLYNSLFKD